MNRRTLDAAARRESARGIRALRRFAAGLDSILADVDAAAERLDAAAAADPTLLAGPTLEDLLDAAATLDADTLED
jgi:hypothetical protein